MSTTFPLAIIGMGCRFPGGVKDGESFWRLLIQGQSGIQEVPADRWDWKKYHHPEAQAGGYMVSKWGGFLDDHDRFDAHFFGISPREATRMDPQQRWLLEIAWETLEDAGIPPFSLRGEAVGVFVGASMQDYFHLALEDRFLLDVHTNTGIAFALLPNRISYFFDLRGPSVAVDTACSSALTAIHQAAHSIWSGESTLALAGGCNLVLNPAVSIGFSRATMLSPSGQCYAFDHRANGYVRSEGAGLVLLKPLTQAQADGDAIYAVLRGTAVNQDGRTSSITVPNTEAQEAMLRQVYRQAGVDPATVAYVESHGTGTPVGDPLEANALGRVFSVGRPVDRPCLIGSVKTNIGHLESGAGIAGLIKALLVLRHGIIPPNLNFERPNPEIPLRELGLRVVTEVTPLPDPAHGLPVVGVNSFGFGGANAHTVLEAPPPASQAEEGDRAERSQRPCLLPLSGHTPEALQANVRTFLHYLARPDCPSLAQVTYTAGARRSHLDHRLGVMATDLPDLRARLQRFLEDPDPDGDLIQGRSPAHPLPLTFVYTGQGAQWWGMGQQLLQREPLFQRVVAEIDLHFRRLSGWSLLDEMDRTEVESRIDRTDIAQPAIFALQVGLTELWRAWGVGPARIIGHSVGEVAAAYAAGIYSLQDAVTILYHRSRLQNRTGGRGGMAAVAVSLAEAEAALYGLAGQVQVAAVNSPSMVTLAGDLEPLGEIVAYFEAAGSYVRRLPIDYAFHTHQMDPIQEELLAALAPIQPRPAQTPFISTVSGEPVSGQEMDAAYWWRNVRSPVQFAAGIEWLAREEDYLYLELGPHPALGRSVRETLALHHRTAPVLHSLRRQEDESQELVQAAAALYVQGVDLDWAALNQTRRSVRLPGYAWQRERYWLESESHRRRRLEPLAHPLLGLRAPAEHPTWENWLDLNRLPYLRDHRVADALLFPATGYVELGLALARTLFSQEPYAVDRLTIHQALFVEPERPAGIRTVFQDADNSFSVYASSDGKTQWTLQAQGYLQPVSAPPPPPLDLAAQKEALALNPGPDEFYAAHALRGYQYGNRFKNMAQSWSDGEQALAEIHAPQSELDSLDPYLAHPAVLDCCLHAILATNGPDIFPDAHTLLIPVAIDQVRFWVHPLPARLWAHACPAPARDNRRVYTVTLYDELGRPVGQVAGLSLAPLTWQGGQGEERLPSYGYQWQPQPPPESMPAHAPPSLLLLAEEGDLVRQLRQILQAAGTQVIGVERGSAFARLDGQRFQINPASPADMEELLAVVGSSLGEPTLIVHAYGLGNPLPDGMSSAELAQAQEMGVLCGLHLTQTVERVVWQNRPRLWLLTQGAQAVQPGDEMQGLAMAPLMGFVRSARNEYPHLGWAHLDLDPAEKDAEAAAQAVAAELWVRPDEVEIACRGRQRYALRLQPMDLAGRPYFQREAVQLGGEILPYRLQIDRPGVLSDLRLAETLVRPAAAGEVQIQVRAGGLNFRDVMKALGAYPGNSVDRFWLGDDFAGVVTATGPGVADLHPGDAVAGIAPYAFHSHLTAPRELLFKLPPGMDFPQAATLPTVFLTAYVAICRLARMQPGESILIHAATGGVGMAAIQIAQEVGLTIHATAGTEQKRARLREMGVSHIYDSRTLDYAEQILAVTRGRGVDAVLNSLAGDFIRKNFEVLAPFGRYLELGKVDIYKNRPVGMQSLRHNISLHVIDLSQYLTEQPQEVARLLRILEEKVAAGVYRPLPHTLFSITEAAQAFNHMAAGNHMGKNVLSFVQPTIPVGRRTQAGRLFRPDAAYLITGGVGGFGLLAAGWLAEQGACRIALLSRSGPRDEQSRTAIQRLRERGVQVMDVRGDVTVEADVSRAVAEIQEALGPLVGVFHGAGILDDRFIQDLDVAAFNRALSPKMAGAWHLHCATRELPLEHFVCFSSVASILGNMKQANYSAGNAFLDALAHYRRARGLPALSINWGVLGEAGLAARDERFMAYSEALGLTAMPARSALSALQEAMLRADPQVIVALIDWTVMSTVMPSLGASAVFQPLMDLGASSSVDDLELSQRLALSSQDPVEIVSAMIVQTIAQVTGARPERIAPEHPLAELGLDSLMAVQMVNLANSKFHLNLSVRDVLDRQNVEELAFLVLEKLLDSLENEEPG